jgi:hypothetical protein
MKRKNRNNLKDKIVKERIIYMEYGKIGMIKEDDGLFVYFVIMEENGLLNNNIFGIRKMWD